MCGTECCAVPQQRILLQVVQLRAVYYIGAGCRNRTFSNISDFAGGITTVCGAECSAVPQQSILLQVVQLRAVYYIGAGGGNSTLCNVNDFVLGFGALYGAISVFDDIAGTKCSLASVPVQSVIVDSQKRISHIIVGAAFQLVAWRIYTSISIYASTTPESECD